jgi:hypothetical protein
VVDVFISYKREDRARVDRLAGLLDDLGADVWHDAALGAGEAWQTRIEAVARAANCVVVCWTDQASNSPWILRELRIGLERKVLVPVKFSACTIPANLAHLHFSDLTDWDDGGDHKGMRQLIDGVDAHLRKNLRSKLEERIGGQSPEAVSRLRALLVQTARNGGPVLTYEEAHRAIAAAWKEGAATPFNTLYGALDAIADQNRARREPPLFALVVKKGTGIPGRGYFEKHCFLSAVSSDEARSLHAKHLKRVFGYRWPNDP